MHVYFVFSCRSLTSSWCLRYTKYQYIFPSMLPPIVLLPPSVAPTSANSTSLGTVQNPRFWPRGERYRRQSINLLFSSTSYEIGNGLMWYPRTHNTLVVLYVSHSHSSPPMKKSLISYIAFRQTLFHLDPSLHLRLTHAPKPRSKIKNFGPAASGLTILG